MTAPKPKLRWFQYSLRTLLVFVTLCAIPCSWLAVQEHRTREHREAVAGICRSGGYVYYGHHGSGNKLPDWLHKFLGKELFGGYIQCIDYCGNRRVTDEDLLYLEHLDYFDTLVLSSTQISDTGLKHLKGSTHLDSLALEETPITDAGLEHLKGLNELKLLDLCNTKVTDEGVKKLQQALPNCEIIR